MNSGRSGGGSTVARLAFRYLLLPEGDANEGTFRPLKLILPEGTIVSARPTAADGLLQFGAADADRSRHPRARPGDARPGGGRALRHVLRRSPMPAAIRTPGMLWQCHDSGFGGWGALCDMDGPGPFRTMCHGDTRLIPIEVHEATYPFMIESFGLRTGFRRTRPIPRRAWARAPLSDAGAVPHLDPVRAHALARPGA